MTVEAGNQIRLLSGSPFTAFTSAPLTVSGPGISVSATPGLPKVVSTDTWESYESVSSGSSSSINSLTVLGSVLSGYASSTGCISLGDGGSGYSCTNNVYLRSQLTFTGVTLKAYDPDGNQVGSLGVGPAWTNYWNKLEAAGDALLLYRSDGYYLGKIVFEFPPPECLRPQMHNQP